MQRAQRRAPYLPSKFVSLIRREVTTGDNTRVSADCRQLASRKIGPGRARPRKPMIISLTSLPKHVFYTRLCAQDPDHNKMQRNAGTFQDSFLLYISQVIHFNARHGDSEMIASCSLFSLFFLSLSFLPRSICRSVWIKSKANKINASYSPDTYYIFLRVYLLNF